MRLLIQEALILGPVIHVQVIFVRPQLRGVLRRLVLRHASTCSGIQPLRTVDHKSIATHASRLINCLLLCIPARLRDLAVKLRHVEFLMPRFVDSLHFVHYRLHE